MREFTMFTVFDSIKFLLMYEDSSSQISKVSAKYTAQKIFGNN